MSSKILPILLAIAFSFSACSKKTNDSYVYVGTYTGGDSEGIYTYKLNMDSGELIHYATTTGIENPSFLAPHQNGKWFYSVSQIRSKSGDIQAFKRDLKTGLLTTLNSQSSEGAGPCHLIVDKSGKWILAANYTGGTISILPIKEDGSLGPATDKIQHSGSSANPDRQQEPHPHSIWVSPDNRFAFVPDLGTDKINIYKLDLENGKFLPSEPEFFETEPGAGPRHFTFHPNGEYAFVINELKSTMTSMEYNKQNGALTKIQTVSTLPAGFTDTSYCADVHTSPDGNFVFGSNRGHNSIALFAFDEQTGELKFIEAESTQGDWPRNFAVDPAGKILLAANQNSNDVFTYWINQKTGMLTPTGFQAKIPSPVCLKLVKVE